MHNIIKKLEEIYNNSSKKDPKATKELIQFFTDIYSKEQNSEVKRRVESIDVSKFSDLSDFLKVKKEITDFIEEERIKNIANEEVGEFLYLIENKDLPKNELIKLRTCLKKLNRFKKYGGLYNEIFKEIGEIKTGEDAFKALETLEKRDEELSEISNKRTMYEIFGIEQSKIGEETQIKLLKTLYESIASNEEQDNEKEKVEREKQRAIEAATKGNSKQANAIKNISDLLDIILKDATDKGSSDIHIEPKQVDLGDRKTDLYVRIRFRIDGDLIDQPGFSFFSREVPYTALRNLILSRCQLSIDQVKNSPLDGKFTYFYTNEEKGIIDKKLEIRVASVPILGSQGIVMRILGGYEIPDLRRIGLITNNSTYFYDQFLLGLKKSQGMVLVTGPTGSGKTSTLNSTMKYLTGGDKESLITGNKRQDLKCITCEDPIEIELKTTMQSAVSSQDFSEEGTVRLTFDTYAKSSLRLDPDIVLLGEIRDRTSVNIGIKIAITGHQLLGTLHTSSCASTITRIIGEAGDGIIESLTDALNMILAQRLVKVPCKYCSTERKMTPKESSIVRKILQQCNKETLIKLGILDILGSSYSNHLEGLEDAPIKKQSKEGCEHCNYSGVKGRTPLFEIMIFDRKMKRALLEFGKSAVKIEEFAVKECGMPLLVHGGLINMLEGKVTYEALDDLVNLEISASD